MGVILYELLAGRVPFNATTLGDLLSQVMMDAHAPLASVQSDVPPDLSALVDRCLVKDRNHRAQSVADVARALAPYVPPRALPLVERVVNVVGARVDAPRVSAAPPMMPMSSEPPPPAALAAAGAAPSAPLGVAANTAPTWSGTQATEAPRQSGLRAIVLAASVLVVVGGIGGAGAIIWNGPRPASGKPGEKTVPSAAPTRRSRPRPSPLLRSLPYRRRVRRPSRPRLMRARHQTRSRARRRVRRPRREPD